jgi:hypothetical protein
MIHALSRMRNVLTSAAIAGFWRASRTARLCALATLLLTAHAAADDIDLSLNVFYSNPSNPASGGTWQVVARTDVFGLAGLQMYLTNIATAAAAGPRGVVNGTDPAGLSIFVSDPEPGLGFTEVIAGQILLDPSDMSPTDEQSAFYGIGALQNGAPNYPGRPAGTNAIGPAFTSLTGVQNVPWATGDAFGDVAWNTGARIATGTFNPGATPGFFQSPLFVHNGTVFTSLGTNKVYGQVSGDVVASTVVRTNLTGVILPDYNRNGRVDAADFVLWRKTEGQMGAGLVADGNSDGKVDQADYNLWRMHFGAVAGSGAGASTDSGDLSTNAVPEPSCGVILTAIALFGLRRARSAGRNLRTRRMNN